MWLRVYLFLFYIHHQPTTPCFSNSFHIISLQIGQERLNKAIGKTQSGVEEVKNKKFPLHMDGAKRNQNSKFLLLNFLNIFAYFFLKEKKKERKSLLTL